MSNESHVIEITRQSMASELRVINASKALVKEAEAFIALQHNDQATCLRRVEQCRTYLAEHATEPVRYAVGIDYGEPGVYDRAVLVSVRGGVFTVEDLVCSGEDADGFACSIYNMLGSSGPGVQGVDRWTGSRRVGGGYAPQKTNQRLAAILCQIAGVTPLDFNASTEGISLPSKAKGSRARRATIVGEMIESGHVVLKATVGEAPEPRTMDAIGYAVEALGGLG